MSNEARPNLPAGWSLSQFDEIGSVSLGRQRSPANHTGPSMRPYIRAANVTWSGLDLTDVKEMNFDANDFARFRLLPGDVLINEGSGSAAEVGKPAIWRGEIADCCFQNTLLRVQPRACTSEFVCNYIRWCARSGQFVASTQGVNIFHIGREGLARHKIPVPPLPEQHRIVAKIDSLSSESCRARGHLQQADVLIRKYKSAVVNSLLGANSSYQYCAISDLCRSIADGDHQPPPVVERGIPFITISTINDGHLRLEKATRQVPVSYYEGLKPQRRPERGDVLFAVTGATIGLSAIIDTETNFVFQRHIAILKPDRSKIIPNLLLHAVRSMSFLDQMYSAATGTAQPTVPISALRNFRVRLPPVDQQVLILRRIEAAHEWIDKLAAEAASARKLIDHLDRAVLSKAFRGELVRQDPNDEPASVLLDRIKAEQTEATPARRGRGRPRLASAN